MQKVLIIGGGFAGLHVAKRLRNSAYNVLLIDKQNHHQFQPLFYQVASARLEPSNISFPFRKIFQKARNISFRLAGVQEVVPDAKKVVTDQGTYDYDILILATGCTTNYFGNKQIEAHSMPMKSTLEAIAIRNEILLSFER